MAKVVAQPTSALQNFSGLHSRSLTMTPRPHTPQRGARSLHSRRSVQSDGAQDRYLLSRSFSEAVISPRSRLASTVAMSVSLPGRNSAQSPRSEGSAVPDPKLSSVEVESLLRDHVKQKFSEMKQAFQTLDADRTLTVTQSEFQRVIDQFCFPLTKDQFSSLVKKIGVQRNGTVAYTEFLERFNQGGTSGSHGHKWLSSVHRYNQTRTPSRDLSSDELEQQLKSKIISQLQNVLKAMRLFDYNRDGEIQRHELRRVLENFCFKMTDAQYDKLWNKYDLARNGHTLKYADFLKRLGVSNAAREKKVTLDKTQAPTQTPDPAKVKFVATNARRPATRENAGSQMGGGQPAQVSVKDLERRLRHKMIENFGNIKRAFVAFDCKRTGFVTLDELKRVLSSFVFPMSDQLFQVLMDRCGVRANHKIGYDQFLEKFQPPRTEGNGQTIPIKPNHKFNPIREAEESPSSNDMWELLAARIRDNHTSLKKAFLAFDDNKDGRITRKEFRKILESFCFRMSEEQYLEMMSRIDPQNKGYISYWEFLDRFEEREDLDGHPWLLGLSAHHSVSPPAVVAWATVEDILRAKISDSWKSIYMAFSTMDEDRSGRIAPQELRKLLERYCVPLSDEHFEALWTKCNINADGSIQFQEFLNNLGVDIVNGDMNGPSTRICMESDARADLMKHDQNCRMELQNERTSDLMDKMTADDVMQILKDNIMYRSPSFHKTFMKFTSNKSGKLSRKEFRTFLESLGLYMTDEQFRVLSARLGFLRGSLSYQDFLDNFQDQRSFNVGDVVSPPYPDSSRKKVILPDHSMSAEDVFLRFKNKLAQSFQGLREAFYKIDDNHDGHLTRAEFRRVLDQFMFNLSEDEFNKLMNKLGVLKGNRLNYRDFLNKFEQQEKIEEGHPWLYSTHKYNVTNDIAYIPADEADKIIRRKAFEQMQDLAKAFRSFDKDGNGIVTKKELRNVLFKFQIPMTKDEFNKLWHMYDTDRNGFVDHDEFLAKLGAEFGPGDFMGLSTRIQHESNQEMESFNNSQMDIQNNATRNQAQVTSFLSAMEVEQQLRDRFRDGYESFRKAFEAADTNRDGFVSRHELQQVLFDFHFFLDSQQLNILLQRVGLGDRDKLSYEKFLNAFEDSRKSMYHKVTLDAPLKEAKPVVFESYEGLQSDQAIVKLRNKIGENRDTIAKAFVAFDREGSGNIGKKELKQIIDAFLFKMTDKQFNALIKQIDLTPDGKISYQNFLSAFERSDLEASRKWLDALLEKTKAQKTPSQTSSVGSDKNSIAVHRVKEVVVARFYKLAKAFTDHDVQRNGAISRNSFRQVLNEHVFRMNDEQFDHIWKKCALLPDGQLDYREFLKKFSTRTGIKRASSATPLSRQNRELESPQAQSPSPARYTPQQSVSDVEKKIRDKVCRNWQQLQKSFRSVDTGNTGQVTLKQFRDILLLHQLPIHSDDIQALWKKYDVDNTGKITYKSFLKHFVISMNGAKASNLLAREKLQRAKFPVSPGVTSDEFLATMAKIRPLVVRDWREMRRAFRAADSSGSGVCTPPQFRQLLKRYQIDLSEEQFFHVYSYFDKNMEGRISYNDFLRAHLE